MDEKPKIDLKKHTLAKASKFYLIKFGIYTVILAILMFLLIWKLNQIDSKSKTQDKNFKILIEK